LRAHAAYPIVFTLAALGCGPGASSDSDAGPLGPANDAGGDDGAHSADAGDGPRSPEGRDGAAAGDADQAGADARDTGADASAGPQDAGRVDYDQVAPTPPASWVSVTNNLAGLSSECGNMGGVYPDPHADVLITGVALQGLWASTDGAQTWSAIGAAGDKIKNRLTSIVFDPTQTNTFWESGIYGWETGTDGVFVTTNGGTSFSGFAGLATAQNGGNTNDSVAIDFSDPQRKTLLASTHEQSQLLYVSTNAGSTWSGIGASLPASLGFCTSTLVLDASTFLVGCAASWSGKAGAILRSTTTGASFTQVYGSGVVGQPLVASDGAIYWAAEGGGIDKSTDHGQTWNRIADANTAGSLPPFELPDGRIVSAQQQNIVITADKGATWTPIGKPMPYTANGLSYSPFRSAFFIWHFTCNGTDPVPADGIMRFGWSYR
jgi:hypothetical protein